MNLQQKLDELQGELDRLRNAADPQQRLERLEEDTKKALEVMNNRIAGVLEAERRADASYVDERLLVLKGELTAEMVEQVLAQNTELTERIEAVEKAVEGLTQRLDAFRAALGGVE